MAHKPRRTGVAEAKIICTNFAPNDKAVRAHWPTSGSLRTVVRAFHDAKPHIPVYLEHNPGRRMGHVIDLKLEAQDTALVAVMQLTAEGQAAGTTTAKFVSPQFELRASGARGDPRVTLMEVSLVEKPGLNMTSMSWRHTLEQGGVPGVAVTASEGRPAPALSDDVMEGPEMWGPPLVVRCSSSDVPDPGSEVLMVTCAGGVLQASEDAGG